METLQVLVSMIAMVLTCALQGLRYGAVPLVTVVALVVHLVVVEFVGFVALTVVPRPVVGLVTGTTVAHLVHLPLHRSRRRQQLHQLLQVLYRSDSLASRRSCTTPQRRRSRCRRRRESSRAPTCSQRCGTCNCTSSTSKRALHEFKTRSVACSPPRAAR